MASIYNIDERIEDAVKTAIMIANDDSHGYDQECREGQNFDCSSLIAYCLRESGFDINVKKTTTHNFVEWALSHGFSKLKYFEGFAFSRGDIVINPNHHMVIMVNDHECVSATINEKGTITGGQSGDQTGKEIRVRSMYQPNYGWLYVIRHTFYGVAIPEQAFSFCPVLRKGSRGDSVRICQAVLAYKLEDLTLEVDGIFGERTAEAVAKWQELHSLEVDSVIGKFTYLSLFTQT